MEPNKAKKIARHDLARGLMRAYKVRNRDLARQIDVDESTVCGVLAGRKKSRRVQQAIAFAVGVPYEEIWGNESQETFQANVTRGLMARELMRTRKIRNRDIAKQTGVNDSVVSHLLAGRGKSRRVQQAIALAVGVPFEELWGEPK